MRSLNEREREALAEARGVAGDIAATARSVVVIALPGLIRLACVAACVAASTWAAGTVWLAFGGDVPAALPTAALVLLPTGAALVMGLSWGGLIAGAVLAAGAGVLVPLLSLTGRSLLVVGLMAAVVVWFAFQTEVTRDEQEHG